MKTSSFLVILRINSSHSDCVKALKLKKANQIESVQDPTDHTHTHPLFKIIIIVIIKILSVHEGAGEETC